MKRPVVLDFFSCRGGAAWGYHLAGFDVIGFDIADQPGYPFTFVKADVMELDLAEVVAATGAVLAHASPPCQRASRLRHYQPETIEARYPDLIVPVREKLRATGLPYVIENVRGAALIDPIELCGCMFRELEVYRPRRFELGFGGIWAPGHQSHTERCTRNGYLPTPEAPRMSVHGGKHSKAWQRRACAAMGVEWMAHRDGDHLATSIREVCEAIPPAYTRHIGSQLMSLRVSEVAA